MSRQRVLPYLLTLLAACGGRSHETRDAFGGGPPTRPTPNVAIESSGGAAGAPETGAGAEDTLGGGGGRAGGAGAAADNASLAGAAGAPPECEVDEDCGISNACETPSCAAGRCRQVDEPYGSLTSSQSPGDCAKTICSGTGASQTVPDPDDLPQTDTPCLTPLCTNAGPSSAPSPARTACALQASAGLCDGSGACVACLEDADCSSGLVCGRHSCVPAGKCNDGLQDGKETGVDCGGPECDACLDGSTCSIDQDCKSDVCDPLFLSCLPLSCRDGVKNNDETDVDCGGATCAGCYLAKKCNVDSDCATDECLAGSCGGNPCTDKRQDGSETDVDCGGNDCGPCFNAKKCRYNFDCYSGFCGGSAPRRCY